MTAGTRPARLPGKATGDAVPPWSLALVLAPGLTACAAARPMAAGAALDRSPELAAFVTK